MTKRAHQRRSVPSVRPIDAICAFVASAPIAAALFDRELRFLKVSPAWLADFRMSEEEIIGKVSYDVAPDTLRYVELHKRCLAGEWVSGEPERILLPSGRAGWLTWDASPWRDEHGEIAGLLIISRDVTSQMEAQEEAKQARSFLSTVLENVPLGIMVKDEQGRLLMMNRASEEIFGFTREQALGRSIPEVLGPKIGGIIQDEDLEAFRSETPISFEDYAIDTEHGGQRMLRKTKVVVRNDNQPDYMLVVAEDITERKREQLELERTRTFLGTVIDNVPVGLIIRQAEDGRVVIMNPANHALLGGRTPDQVIGKTMRELFPPEDAEARLRQDHEILASGDVCQTEEDVETPHRGLRNIRKLRAGITAQDGSSYIMSITDDVTDYRRAQAELEQTRKFLETVIENIPVGLTVKDSESGKLLVTNPAIEAMFAAARGQNLGKDVGQIFPEDQARRLQELDEQVIRTGEMLVLEEEPTWTPAGVRHMNRRKVLIRNADGPDYLLSISEDVTERKAAKDALRDALARAEAANVAKSEFLANMSHEIRTPLNGVLGLADALARMELTPKQCEIVAMIVSSGRALTAILSDVLDLAKAEAGQLELREESFSLAETIGSAAYLFETVARDKGLDFVVDLAPEGPDRLVGDPLRLRQIVSNLINNAVKFTSEGRIAVRAAARLREDGAADVEVTVEDSGPGIAEAARAKLFGRFEQGDGSITRQYGGTGLGLSIAATLARMMGGEISCDSAPGEGARFVVRVRAVVDSGAVEGAGDAGEEARPGLAGRALRVLLAEDHLVNQKVVQLMLEGLAEVAITANGREAVDAFLGEAAFDVILMDMQMPVMDGMSAIREIRRLEAQQGRPRTPIIALTANAMSHQVQAALEAGADLHLAKPITSQGLHAAIGQVLDPSDAPMAEAAQLR